MTTIFPWQRTNKNKQKWKGVEKYDELILLTLSNANQKQFSLPTIFSFLIFSFCILLGTLVVLRRNLDFLIWCYIINIAPTFNNTTHPLTKLTHTHTHTLTEREREREREREINLTLAKKVLMWHIMIHDMLTFVISTSSNGSTTVTYTCKWRL